ncbi:MAG: hypothetical protein WCK96_05150 [Methylococcales bacterium]
MQHSLERLLKSLANQHDHITAAYFTGFVKKDNQNQRALNQLEQQKILVKYDEDSYRLTNRLSHFLDHALDSERVKRLDTDLGSWMDTLEQYIGLHHDAWHEQREADYDNYRAEIERLIFDLADTLEENTSYLVMQVSSHFANVRTLTEKRRQNEFYLSRAEKLVNAVSSLATQALLEKVEDHPELHQLLQQHLFNALDLYRQRLQDTLDKLKDFLFEFRQIEARAQLVRSFAFFLQKNPHYQLQDWSESDTIPAHWNQIKPLSIAAYADISDRQLEDELDVIVQKLKTDSLAENKPTQRTVNAITQQVAQKTLVLPAHSKQLDNYFANVQNATQAISALVFQQEFVSDIDARFWLACVLHDYLRRQHRQGLQMEFVEAREENCFTGNKKVRDILVRCLPK